MKIILCLHHFLPNFVAGTEIYTLRLAQQLSYSGLEVAVMIPHFNSLQSDEYYWEGIRVIRYAENSVENRKMFFGNSKPEGVREFIRIIKREEPDVIHFQELSHGRGTGIFHVEAAKKLKIPVVLTFHLAGYTCFTGSLVYKDETKCDGVINIKKCTACVYRQKNVSGIKATVLGKAANTLYKLHIDANKFDSTLGTALGFPFIINKIKTDLVKLSTLAERIVVLTKWYKDILEKNGVPAAKILYIKQGLTGEIPSILNRSKIKLPLKIVFIGRISPMKGLHLLIDAVCQLPEEKISLNIYGSETEDGYVDECKQKAMHHKNIQWMGTVAAEKVIATLSNYHILCLPSTFSEMSPLVIQEAFAAGLPVLASDVYGNAEQINDGLNGWLFRFKDSNDLAEKLKYLTSDLNIVERARLHLPVPKEFKSVANRYIELYEAIIQNLLYA